MSDVLRSEAVVDVPPDEAFAWHGRPGALQRLSPPFLAAEVIEAPRSLDVGTKVVLRTPVIGRVGVRWTAEHTAYDPPHLFRDVQRSGPFAAWDHTHHFEPHPRGTRLIDEVTYRLPFGAIGRAVAGRQVRRRLTNVFDYRHAQTVADLAAHAQARRKGTRPMHVVVTGASGLIGRQLVAFLQTGGHRVTRLVRRSPSGPDEAAWNPSAGRLDRDVLRGADAVVHLAGEGIGDKRWTDEQRRAVVSSRVESTGLLADALASMDDGPRVLVHASAIGYYGDRGDETLTEASPPGGGFLAEVCAAWEAAAQPARDAGLRVAAVRIGIVQTPEGGALSKLLPLFRLGVGGPFGSGRQWVSWIAIDDVVGVLHHALTTGAVDGAINAVAPEALTNREHARVLGRVLRRPAVLPVPSFGPKLVVGAQMATELLFFSQRVVPQVAQRTGYEFRFPTLEPALRHVLGKPAA